MAHAFAIAMQFCGQNNLSHWGWLRAHFHGWEPYRVTPSDSARDSCTSMFLCTVAWCRDHPLCLAASKKRCDLFFHLLKFFYIYSIYCCFMSKPTTLHTAFPSVVLSFWLRRASRCTFFHWQPGSTPSWTFVHSDYISLTLTPSI